MIRFLTAIVVEGRSYAGGETVPEADIPAGSLVSLLRLAQAERVPDAPPAVLTTPTEQPAVAPPAPKPAAKKASA